MKDYYTIGETAKLLGVSAQALRYYDRENILRPEYINEQTGYRYYTYRQFHIIDRIKYFQSFGLSLEEIGDHAFDGFVNARFEVSEENRHYSAIGGSLMNKAGDTIYYIATGPDFRAVYRSAAAV